MIAAEAMRALEIAAMFAALVGDPLDPVELSRLDDEARDQRREYFADYHRLRQATEPAYRARKLAAATAYRARRTRFARAA